MTSPAPPRASRMSVVLLVVVILSLCVGAAASLVASAATAPSYQPGPIQDLYPSPVVLGYTFLAGFLFVCCVAGWIWLSRGKSAPTHTALTALVLILALLLLLAVLRLVPPMTDSSQGTSSSNPPVDNSTGTAPPPTNNTTGIVSSPGQSLGYGGLHIPTWTLFVAGAVAAVIGGAFLAPALLRRAQDPAARRRALRREEVDRARGALQSAVHALDRGEEPRDVIIRLYGSLLERVAPIVGGVDQDTPEEIRTTHLVALGIRPEPAATLTRLFEEARYSSHPLGSEAATRAVTAISVARADLDRVRPDS
jgi:hypothetical protein